MLSLSEFTIGAAYLTLGALVAVIAVELLIGKINTTGLLYGTKRDGTRYFSPERVQLLIVTLAFAFQYLNEFLQSDRISLPQVPESWTVLLGGSHAVYLTRKAYFMLFTQPKKSAGLGDRDGNS